MRRRIAIRGEDGARRLDWIQLVLGIWVVVGLIVLAIVVAANPPS